MERNFFFFEKSGIQMCSIANSGEIKFLFLLLYPAGGNVITYVIRSSLSHRVLRCFPAGGVGATLGAPWPDVNKGVGFLHFP